MENYVLQCSYLLFKPRKGGPLTFKLTWHEVQERKMMVILYYSETPAGSELFSLLTDAFQRTLWELSVRSLVDGIHLP